MDDKGLYRKTFSQIHTTAEINEEKLRMKQRGHRVWKRTAVMAAAICALLCCGAAAVGVAHWLGLQDLVIRNGPAAGPLDIPAEQWVTVNLQGYSGSPEYQAMAEWTAFLDGYDMDGSILEQIGNSDTGLPGKYDFYSVYTQEMADALDGITERYGLKLHTELYDILSREDLFRRVGGVFFGADHQAYSTYMYEDGTFHYDGDWDRPSGGYLEYQLMNCKKGSFTDAVMVIGQPEDYTQWQYETACGVPAVLALSDAKGLIIADLGDAFLTVNILGGSSIELTGAELEAMADSFDLSILRDAGALEREPAEGDYSVCTSLPAAEVEAYAARVRQEILDRDWDALADQLVYPVLVEGCGLYMDSGEFRSGGEMLDRILGGAAFRAALEGEDCRGMFCNYQGVMLGNGQVWIAETMDQDSQSKGLKVFALNPGAESGETAEPNGGMEQNQFALFDVDGDGRDELLLQYTATVSAGMMEGVYDSWKDGPAKGALLTELAEYPLLTFYDNGVVLAGWSHNQGLAGDSFWPYTLYRYDGSQDLYIKVALVDAWDKSCAAENSRGEPFPNEVDRSGSGMVYYIMDDGYDTSSPVDAGAYEDWLGSWLDGAKELTIPYQSLTEENIRRLG